ncbi:uncharacterized protein LOC135925042 isoform X2 [Gordionus sp. m RMFG-2023]|uniref:uncharacterized protein LOC135925042 isoform X2 n=1 Tax=Gordionus sp. m RMFG-2023 TaxID=3053472 RepID=UPI0031FDEC24
MIEDQKERVKEELIALVHLHQIIDQIKKFHIINQKNMIKKRIDIEISLILAQNLWEKKYQRKVLSNIRNANLRHGIKQALQNAEKQDTSLKSIKEMKNSLLFTRDIKLASNPDNPIEKTSLLESINSSNFSQIPFISSSKKKTETNSSSNPNEANVNKHDNAMFGSKPIPDTQKLDLASIQLPNERPLYSLSISSITDPKMLIHKQYHVTKEEKFKSWITYIENISKEINV